MEVVVGVLAVVLVLSGICSDATSCSRFNGGGGSTCAGDGSCSGGREK